MLVDATLTGLRVIEMPARLIFLLICLLSFSSGQALGGLVVSHSFESDAGLGPGFHLGTSPSDLTASGRWGSGALTGRGVVVDPTLARTGDTAMVIDHGERNAGSTGGGGIWAVFSHTPGAGSFTANDRLEVSAYVAENPNDLVTGFANANLHFEFFDASGTVIFRTDSLGLASFFPKGNDDGDSMPDYTLVSHSFNLADAIGLNAHSSSAQGATPVTAATLANIASARPAFGSWNGGDANPGDGQFLIDDFSFVVAVPEPTNLIYFGFASVCMLVSRRRIA